jgi:glycosyltransferase involved in cell wall biosynthesis
VTKHRLLAAAWVHALPSVKEGWSLAVVESAAHGTPTVAFRSAGGPTESVLDGETGLLVDDVAGFAGALRRLLTEPFLRESMGRAARAHAARFSWPATAAAVETELRLLTGLPPRASTADSAARSSVEAAG